MLCKNTLYIASNPSSREHMEGTAWLSLHLICTESSPALGQVNQVLQLLTQQILENDIFGGGTNVHVQVNKRKGGIKWNLWPKFFPSCHTSQKKQALWRGIQTPHLFCRGKNIPWAHWIVRRVGISPSSLPQKRLFSVSPIKFSEWILAWTYPSPLAKLLKRAKTESAIMALTYIYHQKMSLLQDFQ